MPKYRVEIYNVYLEAFEVEAPTAAEAKQLAYNYEYVALLNRTSEFKDVAGTVQHVTKHEYQYEQTPQVFALTPEGGLIPLGDGEDSEDDPANQPTEEGVHDHA